MVLFFGAPVTDPAGSKQNTTLPSFLLLLSEIIPLIFELTCNNSFWFETILSTYLNFSTVTFVAIWLRSLRSKSTIVACSACSFWLSKSFFSAPGIDASIVPFIGKVKILLPSVFMKVSGEKNVNSLLNSSLYFALARMKISLRLRFTLSGVGKVRFTRYEFPCRSSDCILSKAFLYVRKFIGYLLKMKWLAIPVFSV